ncbi:Immunity protein sdpI [Peptoniphilus harei]|uniref:SdpI family protein n=1 Tax=Peptoniphilus harei TaxID=54005 RepID=A0A943SNV2_9FIRM|nr:SdpI family protein [Peptoniphilus harei]MBS6535345.1 SdpI family protein [Peptoniphilus harei]QQE46644.1 SdpI family protein [Peptoniphilus harei]VEJ35436.1 Immunity protein sdpI [Peptoniphilus harei]
MKNKFKLRRNSIISIVASILILIIFNILFYDKMPAELPTHWNFQGEADDYSSKFHAMVVIQGFLVLMNAFLCFMLDSDPKNNKQYNLVMTISKLSMPAIMLLIYIITVMAGFGREVKVSTILPIFIGLLFIAIGNYLPKIKRNYTMGIKLPWTLNSDENWRRTHRLGGICFVIIGLCLILSVFLKSEIVFLVPLILGGIIPAIYSYYLYTKGI